MSGQTKITRKSHALTLSTHSSHFTDRLARKVSLGSLHCQLDSAAVQDGLMTAFVRNDTLVWV